MTKPPAESKESGKADMPETTIAHRTRNASRRDSVTKEAPPKRLEKEGRQRKPKPKPDYIPPLNRNLGPYKDLLNPPASTTASMDPVDFEFRKYVGLIVKSSSNTPAFTEEFVDELADLSTSYMNHLISLLHNFTEVQRHHRAGVSDLQMCFLTNNIPMSDLYGEYERTQKLPVEVKKYSSKLRSRLDTVLAEFNAEKYTLEKDDPSLVFHANEQYEIAALVPRQSEPRKYIPSYFPDLPPDFTYQNTGSYMKTLTDLKQIKMKLAEESRLNEKSLYKLMGDDDNTWIDTLEGDIKVSSDLESEEEDIMSISGENGTDVESPTMEIDEKQEKEEKGEKRGEKGEEDDKEDAQVEELAERKEDATDEIEKEYLEKIGGTEESHPSEAPFEQITNGGKSGGLAKGAEIEDEGAEGVETSKAIEPMSSVTSNNRFDFVDYARKRRRIKEAQLRAIERRRQKRLRNIYMRAEKLFSCYATSEPNLENVEYFNGYLEDGFKRVMMAMRVAEKHKLEKLARLQQEKVRREQEQEAQNGAFEFGFAFNPAANLLDDSDEDGDEPHDIVFDDQEPREPENLSNGHGENGNDGTAEAIATNDIRPQNNFPSADSMDEDDLGSKIDSVLNEAEIRGGNSEDAESDEDLEDI